MAEIDRLALKILRRDKEALRKLAAAEGETMAVVVRRLVRDAVQQRGLLPTIEGARTQSPEGVQHEHAAQL